LIYLRAYERGEFEVRYIDPYDTERPRYAQPPRRKWSGWGYLFTFLGISAAIALVTPWILTGLFFTFVGIPIALYLGLAPFLLLVTLSTWFISQCLGGRPRAVIAGLFTTLAALSVPPYLENREIEAKAYALVADDRDLGTVPKVTTLAVRQDSYQGPPWDILNCDGLCQRALINGVAQRVLVVDQDISLLLDLAFEADSFRLEKRAVCPPAKLPLDNDPVRLETEQRAWKGKPVQELMQLEISKGNCLIAEKARLGDADVILSVGSIMRAVPHTNARWFVSAQESKADRISMHEKKEGVFLESYRKTYVVMHTLRSPLVPVVDPFSGPTFLRIRETINIDSSQYERPDWTAFLTKRLGFDLALRMNGADEQTRSVLADTLRRDSKGDLPTEVVEDFFAMISRTKSMSGDDLKLAQQLFENPRVTALPDAASAISFATDASPAYFDAVGRAMFSRLRSIAEKSIAPKASDGWGQASPLNQFDLRSIDRVIAALPRDTILKHKSDLDWLSKQKELRVRAAYTVARVHEFGAEGASMLFWLLDDGKRSQYQNFDWYKFQKAVLMGLCRTNVRSEEMIEEIYDRFGSGIISNQASYRVIAMQALLRMGADSEQIWTRIASNGQLTGKSRESARSLFDIDLELAKSLKDCGELL
jgi:hypothetical protein